MSRYTAHVISHTHWDREWYHSFQHFRMRLVDLIDHLMELLESDPDYRYFHLDGQTITLEDYLEIRPENEKRLRQLVAGGRILIGPWYNQPDEFLVSGEAMIRNLLLGRWMCDEWGSYMAVGYVPDAFGHISQMPQILRGFGIDNAVLFRGITADQVPSEFTWQSPDGSQVLCIKMPDQNAYSNFFYRLRKTLSAEGDLNPDPILEEIKELINDCIAERPTTDLLLFMDGVDHIFPNPKTPHIIALANERQEEAHLIHSTLPDFIRAVKGRKPKLRTQTGELRVSNRKWTLQALLTGVMSSRIHLKQANEEGQVLLERWAEPFAAFAWRLGKPYPDSYLRLAWKYLLKNHPHDSICGCSIDQVHRDMVYRFDQSRLIGEKVVQDSLHFIVSQANTQGLQGGTSPDRVGVAALTVFNPLSWTRTDSVVAMVDFPADLPFQGLRLCDPSGREIPFSLLDVEVVHTMDQAHYDIPVGSAWRRHRVRFTAENVPALGYKCFLMEALSHLNRQVGSLVIGTNAAENEHLSVAIQNNGTLTLTGKESGRMLHELLTFEDGGDLGDGYNYIPPLKDVLVNSQAASAQVALVEDSPAAATFRVTLRLPVPAKAHTNRQERSKETVELEITSYITLCAHLKRIDILTEVENNAKDHRLRVLFPSEMRQATVSTAESVFDVVERPIAFRECRDWKEPQPPTHPQKSFVDVSQEEFGLAILNTGLPEYEVKNDAIRTIALTLMRSTGQGVGHPAQFVDGQLPGKHLFRYAIYLHNGDWQRARVWKIAHHHLVPMRAIQTDLHPGHLPLEHSFLSADPDSLVVSAVKKAGRGEAVVVRAYNTTPQRIPEGKLMARGFHKASLADLKEDAQRALEIHGDGTVTLEVGPKQIITTLWE